MKTLILLITLALAPTFAFASKPPDQIIKEIGFDQKTGSNIPLNLEFANEDGAPVQLSSYFKGKPVVLALVYYQCPMLCTVSLNGLVQTLRAVTLDLGKDFEIVTVSFDPREKPALAKEKKKTYVHSLPGKNAENGWHFLTGDEAAIKSLTESVGFRYTFDKETNQFAHTIGLVVATPEGKISHYLLGGEYEAKDLRLSLVDASQNKIGTPVDQILLYCYDYDPLTGKYGFSIMIVLKIGGILTVLGLAGFIVLSLKKEKEAARKKEVSSPS